MTDRERLTFLQKEAIKEFMTLNTDVPLVDFISEWLLRNGVVIPVYCKECRCLYDEPDDYCCTNHKGLVSITENTYCPYGKRKDNNE